MKVPQGRIRTIHNGVSVPSPSCSRQEWRVRLSAHEDELLVAMIGNISPFKDHPTLIGAWRQVLDSFRGRATLLLVGNQLNIERVDEVKRLVSSAGVDGSVIFLDRIDDIAGFLNAIDLVVHASKSEGLPNAVLEAMAAGRAVVGSDIPGIREVLGDTGVYVPAGNEGALATAIMHLLRDENEREYLGARNRSAVQKNFSSTRMCEETVEFLDASWREA
jgi:glycosyltransferase involved in cell wall biosynthesis